MKTGPEHSATPSIADEARRWVVKLDDLTPMEHKRLERWLRKSDANRNAFAVAKREWQSLEFLKELRSRGVVKGDPWVAKKRALRRRNRRYALPLAAAATVAAMAVAIGWSLLPPPGYEAEYYMGVDEQQEVSLPDGSSILLNTRTILNVQSSNEQRDLFLDAARHTPRLYTMRRIRLL